MPGVTDKAVEKAIKSGRISVLADGKIDFEVADIQWEKNTRKRIDFHGAQPTAITPPPVAVSKTNSPDWADHKIRREAAEAKLKEIELAKRKGELIDREGAELAAQKTGRMLRDALVETLPSKLAIELAAITDPRAVECSLRESIRSELHAIFDNLTELADAV